jgi:hypothetical protein
VQDFCKALPEQQHEIKGATPMDQPWIDDTSEAVNAGCPGRKRPADRPAEWDKPLAPEVVKAPAKKGIVKRARERIGL